MGGLLLIPLFDLVPPQMQHSQNWELVPALQGGDLVARKVELREQGHSLEYGQRFEFVVHRL